MNKRWLVLLSCVGAVLLSGYCAESSVAESGKEVAASFSSKGPTATVHAFFDAIEKKDYKKAYSYVSPKGLEAMRTQMKTSLVQAKAFISMMPPEAVAEIEKMEKLVSATPEAFFIGLMEMSAEQDEEDFEMPIIVSEKIDGDKATLTLKDDEGEEEPMELVKEGGKWVILLDPMAE
jgi:hypothetical protein